MNKKKIAAIVLLVLISLAFFTGKHYLARKSRIVEASGTIEATTVELKAKLPGTLKKILVNAGDHVQTGQAIGEIERNDLIAQQERDALTVVKAETALKELLSGARNEEIKEAEANMEIAQVNYLLASADLERAVKLLEIEAISRTEHEKIEANAVISKARMEAAEARLSILKQGSRQERIEAAETEVERNKAVLRATEAVLADLMIVSPLDGVVLSKNYESGEYVLAGSSIVTVANLDDLWIKVYIPTDDLPRIKLGQGVEVTVSGSEKTFTGVVEEIASRGEYTPKTIQTKQERANVVFGVKISLSDSEGILKPGIPADVIFLQEG